MICSSLTPTLAVSTVRPAATVAVTPHRARRPAPEKRATLLVACAPLTTRMTIGRNDAASANQVPTLADAFSRALRTESISSAWSTERTSMWRSKTSSKARSSGPVMTAASRSVRGLG